MSDAETMTARARLWGAISTWADRATTAPLEPRKAAADAAILAALREAREGAEREWHAQADRAMALYANAKAAERRLDVIGRELIDPLRSERDALAARVGEVIEWLEETHAAWGDEGAIDILARLRALAPAAPATAPREPEEQDCACIAPHPACPNCNGTGKVTP
jgi:hypothetical protein